MNTRDRKRGPLPQGMQSEGDKEIRELKEQIHQMQLQIDILKETINVLKKDPGVNLSALKNREKAAIVDALKDSCRCEACFRHLNCQKAVTTIMKALSADRISIRKYGRP